LEIFTPSWRILFRKKIIIITMCLEEKNKKIASISVAYSVKVEADRNGANRKKQCGIQGLWFRRSSDTHLLS
jgi:hypothetical protein